MSALTPYSSGFLEALEEIAKTADSPVKETRKGWLAPNSRKGTRPLHVSTLLKKEKDGTLGGYKLASVLKAMSKLGEAYVPFIEKDDPGAAGRLKRPGDVPSRDEVGGTIVRREDGRGNAATLYGPSTLFEASAQPGERYE